MAYVGKQPDFLDAHNNDQPENCLTRQDKFAIYFQGESSHLEEEISRLEEFSPVGGERQDAIDHVLGGITNLSNEVADAKLHTSPYNQRIYVQVSLGFTPVQHFVANAQETVNALNDKLRETLARVAPSSRFRFKFSNKADSAHSLKDAFEPIPARIIPDLTQKDENDDIGVLSKTSKNYNDEITRSNDAVRKPSFSQAKNIDLSNHQNIHILLPSTASRATSVGTISHISGSIVDMSISTSSKSPFASLVLRDIKGSLIIAGQVAGAAHITRVVDSIVVVASRQVRMHDCVNVKIYLYCTSRPIIEGCKNIQFSPMPECYMTDLDSTQDQWDQVDDFNWLKSEHSPNWQVLPEEKRLNETVWTRAVKGEPDLGLNDILQKTGLKEN